ncbi:MULTISPECIES: hypothetical protein [Leptospira]|uniref:hypothetical protein n=1 Tax=Leptospira TaxID=171 RepID=UPI001EE7E782|nr:MULTISPECIES: hypothetical protein [Leptospira]MCG6162039.1 hypothetical protein [Leptospira bandrabouensis]MCG6170211.1 hypothetical protein [Leptospira sanjuanensis]
MKSILISINFLFFHISCILDPFYSAKDRIDPSQVSREEAEEKIIATAALKTITCGEVSQKGILSRVFLSIGDNLCYEEKSSFGIDNSKNLQSCKNQYSYVSKDNLESCVSEILLSPCESYSDLNLAFSIGYHACTSMLNTRGRISFY